MCRCPTGDNRNEASQGGFLLSQLFRQILRLQVRVSTQHAQVFVAGNGGDLHDVEALLEQSACGFVAQIVKAQVLDSGTAHGADLGAFHSFGGETGKHPAVNAARE